MLRSSAQEFFHSVRTLSCDLSRASWYLIYQLSSRRHITLSYLEVRNEFSYVDIDDAENMAPVQWRTAGPCNSWITRRTLTSTKQNGGSIRPSLSVS
jgi:hypothetical protein